MALEAILNRHHRTQMAANPEIGAIHPNLSYMKARKKEMDVAGTENAVTGLCDLEQQMDSSVPNMLDSMKISMPPYSNVSKVCPGLADIAALLSTPLGHIYGKVHAVCFIRDKVIFN